MASNPEGSYRKRKAGIPIFGILVTSAGIILLLNTIGVIDWEVWADLWRLWPALLVLVGLKILIGSFSPLISILVSIAAIAGAVTFAFVISESDLFEAEFSRFTYELESVGVEQLDLDINFGAGELKIEALDASDSRLIAVEFFDDESHVDRSNSISGSTIRVRLEIDEKGFPSFVTRGDDREWTVKINPSIATNLNVDGGAGSFIRRPKPSGVSAIPSRRSASQ